MFCLKCIEDKQVDPATNKLPAGAWTTGCTRLRQDTIAEHDQFHDDLRLRREAHAIAHSQGNTTKGNINSHFATIANKVDSTNYGGIQVPAAVGKFVPAFLDALHICQRDQSARSFEHALEMDNLKNTPHVDAKYHNHHQHRTFQDNMRQVTREEQIAAAKDSLACSWLLDESTDVSHTGQMILYLVYIDNDYEVRIEFFEMVQVDGADSKSLKATAKKAFTNADSSLWERMVAMCSDGCNAPCLVRRVVLLLCARRN
jgi:hypothetical protein